MQLFANRAAQRNYAIVFACVMALMILGLTRMETPPIPQGADAPEETFSATRAYADLTDLLKENVPHPPGSHANKIIRDRITEKMAARGFDVSIQADFACQRKWGSCSNVENIVATKAGSIGKTAILVMSHYDSVPAGAGATDDGFGVSAMLEIARALSHGDTFKNDLIFLFTDAEETGLLGAEAFAAHHPLMEKVSIVINIESRGTSGTSAMFETGSENNLLLDIYQSTVSRPVANSLTYEVYKRMPNDTDYTVFKNHNVPGFNFASSASASRYHSVLDDIKYADQGTLQHHGDNGLSMVRALGNMDLNHLENRTGEATYFDVYSFFLVKWPSSFNGPLSILGLIIISGFLIQNVRHKVAKPKAILWSLAFTIISIVAVVGLTFVLSFPLGRWLDLHPLDHPNSWPGKIAVIATSLAALIAVARFSYSRTNLTSQLLVTWLIIALISLSLAYTVSGATYLALAPILAFLIGLGVDYYRSKKSSKALEYIVSSHAGLIVATYTGFYHFKLLELVFNFDNSAIRAAVFIIMAFALLPIAQAFYRASSENFRLHLGALCGLAVISAGISMTTPGFTPEKPEPLNILYLENANTKEAFYTLEPYLAWLKEEPSKHYKEMGFPTEHKEYPIRARGAKLRPQQPSLYLAMMPPWFDVITDITSEGERYIEAEISSGRSGHQLNIQFSEDAPIQSLNVKGESPLDTLWPEDKTIGFTLSGTQEDTFRLRMTVAADQPFSLIISESSVGLPETEDTKELLSKRPDNAKANQWGDRTIVFRKIDF